MHNAHDFCITADYRIELSSRASLVRLRVYLVSIRIFLGGSILTASLFLSSSSTFITPSFVNCRKFPQCSQKQSNTKQNNYKYCRHPSEILFPAKSQSLFVAAADTLPAKSTVYMFNFFNLVYIYSIRTFLCTQAAIVTLFFRAAAQGRTRST